MATSTSDVVTLSGSLPYVDEAGATVLERQKRLTIFYCAHKWVSANRAGKSA